MTFFAYKFISTHTLTWSVTLSCLATSKCKRFQLTRSRGAWRAILIAVSVMFVFQLTRSRGAWPIITPFPKFSRNFNSHAHVERDVQIQRIYVFQQISTHTLTWSVTSTRRNLSNVYGISTHTLTWSVTLWHLRCSLNVCISTHTLTWSVTTPCGGYSLSLAFQLTRSRGAWPLRSSMLS